MVQLPDENWDLQTSLKLLEKPGFYTPLDCGDLYFTGTPGNFRVRVVLSIEDRERCIERTQSQAIRSVLVNTQRYFDRIADLVQNQATTQAFAQAVLSRMPLDFKATQLRPIARS